MILALSVIGVISLILFVVLLLGDGSGNAADLPDDEVIAQGLQIYTINCAACHGVNLEGQADWQQKNPDGSLSNYYEGNWRDIFQNWEALAYSYPGFLSGMISKFLNASSVDGYNPYRITRDGIEWEVQEKDDPWSYIGYWGDHQIIYLLSRQSSQKAKERSLFSEAHPF